MYICKRVHNILIIQTHSASPSLLLFTVFVTVFKSTYILYDVRNFVKIEVEPMLFSSPWRQKQRKYKNFWMNVCEIEMPSGCWRISQLNIKVKKNEKVFPAEAFIHTHTNQQTCCSPYWVCSQYQASQSATWKEFYDFSFYTRKSIDNTLLIKF